jgi:hypothetical protein
VVFISSMSNTTILIHGERGKAWRSEAGPLLFRERAMASFVSSIRFYFWDIRGRERVLLVVNCM